MHAEQFKIQNVTTNEELKYRFCRVNGVNPNPIP